ncbi:MAG: GtrA family protein [Myxococcaceae bacterium]
MNSVGAVADYAVMLTARNTFDLLPAAATAMGLVVGSVIAFSLHRRFTFKDAEGAALSQAVRFGMSLSALVSMHAYAVGILCDSFGLHMVLAKLVADITVVPVPQAFLLRRFVFPERRATPPHASAVAIPS